MFLYILLNTHWIFSMFLYNLNTQHGWVVWWLECLLPDVKTTVQDQHRANGWLPTHCPPSSKWVPGGNTGEIMAVRKETGHPTSQSRWLSTSISLTGTSQRTVHIWDIPLPLPCTLGWTTLFLVLLKILQLPLGAEGHMDFTRSLTDKGSTSVFSQLLLKLYVLCSR